MIITCFHRWPLIWSDIWHSHRSWRTMFSDAEASCADTRRNFLRLGATTLHCKLPIYNSIKFLWLMRNAATRSVNWSGINFKLSFILANITFTKSTRARVSDKSSIASISNLNASTKRVGVCSYSCQCHTRVLVRTRRIHFTTRNLIWIVDKLTIRSLWENSEIASSK